MSVRVAVVVPAGGSGTRLGLRTPKQFLRLAAAPILVTTVRRLIEHPAVRFVVVAAPAAHLERTRRLLRQPGRGPTVEIVAGGEARQDSVWRGLVRVPDDAEIVIVHDAVRPFITRQLVDAVVGAALATGAAICARPIAETVKRVRDGLVEATIDRQGLWAVQTPQAFRTALLREAHEKARQDGVVATDDAMLVERLGHPVRVIEGPAANVKITTLEDLRRARRSPRA